MRSMTTTEPEVKGVRNRYSIMGLTREQQHWNAFRRGLWGTLVAFAFAGLVFLGADLDSRALWWVGSSFPRTWVCGTHSLSPECLLQSAGRFHYFSELRFACPGWSAPSFWGGLSLVKTFPELVSSHLEGSV